MRIIRIRLIISICVFSVSVGLMWLPVILLPEWWMQNPYNCIATLIYAYAMGKLGRLTTDRLIEKYAHG